MVAHTPSWSEARCPISPNSASYASANDNNQYPLSPALSPGSWNVASPSSNAMSPVSTTSYNSFNSSVAGTPLSAPAAFPQQRTGSGLPPQIPQTIGKNEERPKMSDTDRRIAQARVNKRFIAKNHLDQEREKSAARKANSLLTTEIGRSKSKPEKKIIRTNKKPVGRVVIIPDGREHMATSGWKEKKDREKENRLQQPENEGIEMQFEEHVEDYKCEFDRDREKWAFKHALKLLKVSNAKNFV